ncbi:ABC transporter ATP-binding protein [Candidatus Woesearchaeota archaeon]|nr:MAG: ABC transporter ATP-binding protein [Candidatus Woesearchaeota archaeon]
MVLLSKKEKITGEFYDPIMIRFDKRSNVRWILSHILAHKGLIFSFIGLSIVALAMNTINPIIAGEIFNVIEVKDWTRVKFLAFILLALTIVSGILRFIAGLIIEIASQRLERDIRDEYYASMLSKSMTFHDEVKAGDVMARATFDTRMVNFLINPCISLLSQAVIGILMAIAGMFYITPYWHGIPLLLLIPIVIAPPIFFLAKKYFKSVGPISMEIQQSYSDLSAYLQEKLLGITVVKAFARENYERSIFKEKNDILSDQIITRGQLRAKYYPALIVGISVGLALIYGVFLTQIGIFDLGRVYSYVRLVANLFFPVWTFSWALVLTQMGLAGAKRIVAILTKDTIISKPKKPIVLKALKGEIEFRDVSFSYDGKIKVIENVSFKVSPGQRVAIVGPAGSGKTTLMKLLTRLYDVDSGQILIDGVDIRNLDFETLRKNIGMIEQDIILFSGTVKQNIAYGQPNAKNEEIIRAAKMAQAHEFISQFDKGYNTIVGERGMTLSGGQKQRIAIARMLLIDPKILIFDDATSSVDSHTEDQIQRAINRVLKNRTSFVITHRLSTIRHSDLIIVMKKGRIVAKGTHEELLKTSIDYWRVFARYSDIREKFVQPTMVAREE